MRSLVLLSAGMTLSVVVAPAAAQFSDPDFRTCQDKYGAEAIAGCTAAIGSGKLSTEYRAITYLTRGTIFLEQKYYARAMADFNKSIQTDPKLALAFTTRGDVYFLQKNYARAMVDYDKAIRLNPGHATTFGNRGQTYFMQKRYVRALADLDEAVRLDPEDAADALYARGLVKMKLRDPSGSKDDIARALVLDPGIAKQFEYLKK